MERGKNRLKNSVMHDGGEEYATKSGSRNQDIANRFNDYG